MSNPANPVLANFVMNDLITVLSNSLSFFVPFLKLYVDDTILAVRECGLDEVLNDFDTYHPRLQFTMEVEKEGKLPF